jgi:hypothetical protein
VLRPVTLLFVLYLFYFFAKRIQIAPRQYATSSHERTFTIISFEFFSHFWSIKVNLKSLSKWRAQTLTVFLASLPILIIASSTSFAQENIEEVVIIGRQEFIEKEFTATRAGANVDAAKLMNQVPGGAAANNGPLTGQIQYRGMFGPRINVRVDRMLIHGGGPNWMAPRFITSPQV